MADRAQIQTIDSAGLTPLIRRAYQNDSIDPCQGRSSRFIAGPVKEWEFTASPAVARLSHGRSFSRC